MGEKAKSLGNKTVEIVSIVKLSNKKTSISKKSQNNTNQFVNDYYLEMIQEFSSDKNIDTARNLTKSLNQTEMTKMKDGSKVAKSVEMSKHDSKNSSKFDVDISQDLARDPNTQSFVSTQQQLNTQISVQ